MNRRSCQRGSSDFAVILNDRRDKKNDVEPIVDATMPLTDVEAAYALLESDTTFGKVILDCR